MSAKAVPQPGLGEAPPRAAAVAALGRFLERSRDARGAALLAGDALIAASGAEHRWTAAARELSDAADAAAPGGCAASAHVATERGEAYLLRSGRLTMVAVCERFSLASLVLADMRATLRELERGPG